MISIIHHMFKVLPIPWWKQVELTRCVEDLKICAMCGCSNHNAEDNSHHRIPELFAGKQRALEPGKCLTCQGHGVGCNIQTDIPYSADFLTATVFTLF